MTELGRTPSPDSVTLTAAVDGTDCTCGLGNESERHYLGCAKWVVLLPNHVERRKP